MELGVKNTAMPLDPGNGACSASANLRPSLSCPVIPLEWLALRSPNNILTFNALKPASIRQSTQLNKVA
jgi:hypothetical protein